MNTRNLDGLPLEGIRVLDFSHAAAGPFASMYLADLGAEVIKIEKPGRGDGARFMGVPLLGPRESDYYLALNRNKKSVLIDLHIEEGVKLALKLAATSDVVLQNFRPGVMDRLGLGYDQIRAVRRGIIYCSISAFGVSGPSAGLPANDIIMQSVSGIMGVTGEPDGGPVRVGAPVTDFSTGLFALSGLLAGLIARDRHPEGQHIEVAMLDSAIALMSNYIPSIVAGQRTRIPRVGRAHAQIVPYQAFECADDAYIMVGAFTNAFWERLAGALGHPEWLADERFATNADRLAHKSLLIPAIEDVFRTRPRSHWLKVLEAADVPRSPVLELHEALVSDQAVHNRVVNTITEDDRSVGVSRNPIRSGEWPAREDTIAPRMGTNTNEVLSRLIGLEAAEIEALASDGVVGLSHE
ncbi:CaiB/BaiF CoA transferase family protein [Actinophytocola sp.]|uniref:CaiB/BaiF CoA transferase family protein n=1 Tax=Actinophytocola sp. TaxID=1872138 RepID=UPI003D6A4EFE